MAANAVEKFEFAVINRNEIHNADYNPRKISESAKKKLKKFLKEKGLYGPIIVNKRTMNIVGGHQRLDAMDQIIRKPEYQLSVALVDLDEKAEIEANIFMNNPSAQGEWDLSLLASIKDFMPDINFDVDLGFDSSDLAVMFPDTLISREAAGKKAEAKTQATEMTADNFREAKKEMREKAKAKNEESGEYHISENDYAITIVFPNNREKARFMEGIGKDPSERLIKSTILYDLMHGKYDISMMNQE